MKTVATTLWPVRDVVEEVVQQVAMVRPRSHR